MRKLVIGMAMASTALASPALARDGQWYIEVQGGPMIVEDHSYDISAPDVTDATGEVEVDLDSYGYDFGFLVGYDFGAFRLEAEGSWREADVVGVEAGNTGVVLTPPAPPLAFGNIPAAGDTNSLSFMLNGLFDFGDDDGLQGFVGGGIGVARTDVHAFINTNGPGAIDDSDTGLAWQLLAGVRAPLNDSWDVGLRYRMFTADGVDLVDPFGRNWAADGRSHSLLGTITYNFGSEKKPEMRTCWDGSVIDALLLCPKRPTPPPKPPVVVPKPQKICNKGPYIVFFDWDKSDITPDAAQTLNSALAQYNDCGTASVMVAGYTDTSGSKQYNVGLSNRRADSVRSYMSGRGVPDARITTEGFGETNLRVPTADGVREPQNRRVEINYGPNSGI